MNSKKTRPLTGNVRARIGATNDQPYISFNKGLTSNFKKSLEKTSSSQIEALAIKKGMKRNATIEEKAKRPLVYNSDLIEEEQNGPGSVRVNKKLRIRSATLRVPAIIAQQQFLNRQSTTLNRESLITNTKSGSGENQRILRSSIPSHIMEYNVSNNINNDTEEAPAYVTRTDFKVMDTNAITTVEKMIS